MFFTIGTFANLSRVPAKTLRYYDEIDLFCPNYVDPYTGYRYYTHDQFGQLYRILALKELGLSLKQIKTILEDDFSLDDLRGMLKLKQVELDSELVLVQDRLQRVMMWLDWLEKEQKMPNYDVILKTVPPIRVASRRVPIPYSDAVPPILTSAFNEVAVYINQHKAKRAAPTIAVWHSSHEAVSDEDAEAAIPIDREIPASDRIAVYELPEVYVASVVHQGNFDDFGKGYEAVLAWIKTNGYQINGPYREVYLKHNNDELGDTATEIQFPVEKI